MSDLELKKLEDELGEEINFDDILDANVDVLLRLKHNGDEFYSRPLYSRE